MPNRRSRQTKTQKQKRNVQTKFQISDPSSQWTQCLKLTLILNKQFQFTDPNTHWTQCLQNTKNEDCKPISKLRSQQPVDPMPKNRTDELFNRSPDHGPEHPVDPITKTNTDIFKSLPNADPNTKRTQCQTKTEISKPVLYRSKITAPGGPGALDQKPNKYNQCVQTKSKSKITAPDRPGA